MSVAAEMNPVQMVDDWAVLSDGAIALVRGIDYHVDFVGALFIVYIVLIFLRILISYVMRNALVPQVTGLAKAAREYSIGIHRFEGVPVGVAAVLQLLLQGGPQTVPRIGRARSTSRQNTQVLVNRMVAERWVELVENPAHKRSALVQLTEEGRQLAKSVTEREVGLHRLVIPQVDADDLEKATALLARLREVLADKPSAPKLPRLHPTSSPRKFRAAPNSKPPNIPKSEPIPGDYELPVNLL
jgi:DNA-binding MarR family transcriptional regulator